MDIKFSPHRWRSVVDCWSADLSITFEGWTNDNAPGTQYFAIQSSFFAGSCRFVHIEHITFVNTLMITLDLSSGNPLTSLTWFNSFVIPVIQMLNLSILNVHYNVLQVLSFWKDAKQETLTLPTGPQSHNILDSVNCLNCCCCFFSSQNEFEMNLNDITPCTFT